MPFDDVDDIPDTAAWSSDGHPLGRIAAVHVPVRGEQPLLVQLPFGADRQQVVPLDGAELRDDGLVLGFDRATIAGAPTVRTITALSAGEAAYVLTYFGVRLTDLGDLSLTDRITAVGDVASVHPRVRGLPPLRAIPEPADPDLPPIVVIKPGVTGDRPLP
jgi:hypothetical protein